MKIDEAIASLGDRLSQALPWPVHLGAGFEGSGPCMIILLHDLMPSRHLFNKADRHIAGRSINPGWDVRLLLCAQAEDLLTQIRIVEAAADHIEACPALSGTAWRADMQFEPGAEWALGKGAAIGVCLRLIAT